MSEVKGQEAAPVGDQGSDIGGRRTVRQTNGG
jgi:hypothetical protein